MRGAIGYLTALDQDGYCPPLVEYSREFVARAAEELALLPERSEIEEMLRDYAVMREQARECDQLDAANWFVQKP